MRHAADSAVAADAADAADAAVGAAQRVAVVGAGWAGLAAAVRSVQAGRQLSLFEMAPHVGGRARAVPAGEGVPDNGQHILIGAYSRTLALMREVGADADTLLWRHSLVLRYPDGRGLALPPGAPLPAFVRAVAACSGWTWTDRIALLTQAAGWALRGFRCDPAWTVDRLCRGLPARVRALLIDPLCVAALNTPASQASAAVLLRVLRDALFSGPGSADLLLPRAPLAALLPEPAVAWLQQRGARLHLGRRVQVVQPRQGGGWDVDGEAFDRVILACTATEAARLAAGLAPAWSARASALRYEPIITAYIHWPGARLPAPMTVLTEGADAPAQFAFDHGAIGATPGLFALVVSGARPWVERGREATAAAVLRQCRACMAVPGGSSGPQLLRLLTEKRATFRCTPGLDRPPAQILPGLVAAGDYVQGPYPATLEGAVRAGEAAAALS